MINIVFDKELDKEVYLDFADFSVAGADFGARIRCDHPDITRKNHNTYINEFYSANQQALQQAADELRNKLNDTQSAFFSATKNIFNTDYSDIKSTGSLSIFDCNPRYPEKNLFQVYYKRDVLGKMEVSYHETLHFMFFRFCSEQCADAIRGRDPNRGAYWELSELFNVIILNQKAFRDILKQEEFLFYPNLSTKLASLQDIWETSNGSVKDFVGKSFRELEKRKN